MIDIMKNRADDFIGERIDPSFHDRFFNAILESMESHGMLPPRNYYGNTMECYTSGWEEE